MGDGNIGERHIKIALERVFSVAFDEITIKRDWSDCRKLGFILGMVCTWYARVCIRCAVCAAARMNI